MVEGPSPSPLHRIVEELGGALAALGARTDPAEVEGWGIALHEALSSRARQFHTHGHVLGLLPGGDPTTVIAALFHDVVYVQVDLGLPPGLEAVLRPLLAKEEAGWRLLDEAERAPAARAVLAVFGRRAGETLTPMTGLNELASALVAARLLASALTSRQLVAVAACVEQTIPFRPGAPDELAARLSALGLDADAVREMVVRAVRLGNRDIGNFATPEAADFLDHTWRLLPESNPELHSPTVYLVRDYRVALTKMEGFLATLRAENVFHEWGGEPGAGEHRRRVEATRGNLAVAVRYLRAKLFAIAALEAIATESGGDAPLEYFMGGMAEPGRPPFRRIEQFLPQVAVHPDVDPALLHLLEGGRASGSSFDTVSSPLAAFLYGGLGEAAVMDGLGPARSLWAGSLPLRAFLERQAGKHLAALAWAASHIATARRERLLALAEALGGSGGRPTNVP